MAAFANVSIYEALNEMPFDLFRLCLRNAFMADCEKSKEGREYLETAHRLMRTEPDYGSIQQLPGYQATVVGD